MLFLTEREIDEASEWATLFIDLGIAEQEPPLIRRNICLTSAIITAKGDKGCDIGSGFGMSESIMLVKVKIDKSC